ncbi:hypothetical protein FB451DRAFT_1178933 [Mycena latifolia]|nr:hypothetical protein FB451DRAFT_1178933 [Mycena latifolia]
MSLARLAHELLDAIFNELPDSSLNPANGASFARCPNSPMFKNLYEDTKPNPKRPRSRYPSSHLANYVKELTVHLDSAAMQFATLKSVLRKLERLAGFGHCDLPVCMVRDPLPDAVVPAGDLWARDSAIFLLASYLKGAVSRTILPHFKLYATLDSSDAVAPEAPVLRFFKIQCEFHGNHLPEALDALLTSLSITAPLLEWLFLKADPLSNPDTSWPESARTHPLFISAAELRQGLPRLKEIHCSRNNLALPKYGFAAYMGWRSRGGNVHVLYIPAVRNDVIVLEGELPSGQISRVNFIHLLLD